MREYFASDRIDLSLERNNRNGKRDARLFQAERRSTVSVSGKTALASSLRSSGDNFCPSLERLAGIPALGRRELRLGAAALFADEIDGHANRVRDPGYKNNLRCEAERAWNVDDRIDRKENRRQCDDSATNGRNPQPDRGAGTNCARTKDRDYEHHEVDNAVKNIRGIIDELKCFLDAGADLARDRDDERGRADEDDRI